VKVKEIGPIQEFFGINLAATPSEVTPSKALLYGFINLLPMNNPQNPCFLFYDLVDDSIITHPQLPIAVESLS
jgi:hypothetical protein